MGKRNGKKKSDVLSEENNQGTEVKTCIYDCRTGNFDERPRIRALKRRMKTLTEKAEKEQKCEVLRWNLVRNEGVCVAENLREREIQKVVESWNNGRETHDQEGI